MNVKQIFGTVTIVVIIGGTIYAIKKSKDAKKIEESAITLEEAQAIVARQKDRLRTPYSQLEVEDSKPISFEEAKQIVAHGVGNIYVTDTEGEELLKVRKLEDPIDEEEYEEEDEEEELYDDGPINYVNADVEAMNEFHERMLAEEDTNQEEDNELRYEPNSTDARNQFIRMELAEWLPLEDNHQTLNKLFEFPFKPQNDGDDVLRTQIIDYRAQFFGFGSRWTQEVTMADIILHYGRAAESQVGETVRYWVDYFLEFNELGLMTPSHEIDALLHRLNNHTYFNEHTQTFGLFGLTRQSMDQAIKIAHRNIDQSVTYEIEFNEFLKACL